MSDMKYNPPGRSPAEIWNQEDSINPELIRSRGILRKTPTGDVAAERMNTISAWLRQRFGRKMIKLALDGGFTCPNRDGTRGTGGCLFCSSTGSGEFSSDISGQIDLLSSKWPRAGYLGYFQNHTNTYAPAAELRHKFGAVLAEPRIQGLVIATRPDCLPEDVMDYLEELNHTCFVWVELGLQTIHERTARRINRCYELSEYDSAMKELRKRNIHVVTHLILGLPGEDRTDMTESLDHVIRQGTWGLKLHMLNVMKGTRLASEYPGYQPFPSIEEYVDLVCDLVERTPPEVTIHRLTADCPRPLLIAPPWSYEKRTILNGINAELVRRGTCQGCRFGFPTTYSCSSTK